MFIASLTYTPGPTVLENPRDCTHRINGVRVGGLLWLTVCLRTAHGASIRPGPGGRVFG